MKESHNHTAKRKKPDPKEYRLYYLQPYFLNDVQD